MSEPDIGPLSRRGTELLDDDTTDWRPHQRAIDILEQAVAAGEPEAAALLARGYRERGQLIEAHELLAPWSPMDAPTWLVCWPMCWLTSA